MRYDLYSKTVQEFKPVRAHLKREPRAQSPFEHCSTWNNYFSFDKIDDEAERKSASGDVISLDAFLCHKGNLETPWKAFVCETESLDNMKINIESIFFSNVTRYVKVILIEDTRLLLQTDKALESISKALQALSEGFFYNIRSIPPSRAPGFVIDGWVVIPEYDRDLQYKIYKELGDTIRNNPTLLFNIHILARKGRDLSKVLPPGYKKYSSWLDYIC